MKKLGSLRLKCCLFVSWGLGGWHWRRGDSEACSSYSTACACVADRCDPPPPPPLPCELKTDQTPGFALASGGI